MAKPETSLDFDSLMRRDGVAPIRHERRAETAHARNAGPAVVARRRAAEGEPEGLSLTIGLRINPHDPLEWKRDGVQEGVYRNLRLGRYSLDARLELIRKPLPLARDELLSFVQQCMELNIRSFIINHGRGRHPDDATSLLRSALNQWLPHIPEVMAFHSAQPQHGGLGALYVMLRKSDAQRQANWEQHQKRQ
ncbi:DNA endonuclease SmrA [Marinobacterium aestuariivivens]|uniref:DNA endonuclease SmrA n=1 Tax=Marinobacterium aestuariivivens TaxID=1698799 RepID=A0ABW1ZUS3_9GAMM